jgi:hypothetical protein
MLAKRIIIRPCKTFRFNLAATKSFNAEADIRKAKEVFDRFKKYKTEIKLWALVWKRPCLKGRISISIQAFPPDKRARPSQMPSTYCAFLSS